MTISEINFNNNFQEGKSMTELELKDMLYERHIKQQKQNRSDARDTMQATAFNVKRIAGAASDGSNAMTAMRRALWQCKPKKKFLKKRTPIRQQTYIVV